MSIYLWQNLTGPNNGRQKFSFSWIFFLYSSFPSVSAGFYSVKLFWPLKVFFSLNFWFYLKEGEHIQHEPSPRRDPLLLLPSQVLSSVPVLKLGWTAITSDTYPSRKYLCIFGSLGFKIGNGTQIICSGGLVAEDLVSLDSNATNDAVFRDSYNPIFEFQPTPCK